MPNSGHKQFLVEVSCIWKFSIGDPFNSNEDDGLADETDDVGLCCSLVEWHFAPIPHTVGEERFKEDIIVKFESSSLN